jgi:hypothetical protein
MRHRGHLSQEERAVRSQLSKVVHGRPFVIGSLVTSRRKCGKENCRCKKEGGHLSTYLSVKVGGERKTIYVPTRCEKKVSEWVKTYKEISNDLAKISECYVGKIREE